MYCFKQVREKKKHTFSTAGCTWFCMDVTFPCTQSTLCICRRRRRREPKKENQKIKIIRAVSELCQKHKKLKRRTSLPPHTHMLEYYTTTTTNNNRSNSTQFLFLSFSLSLSLSFLCVYGGVCVCVYVCVPLILYHIVLIYY